MVDAGRVCDDEGRPVILLRLDQSVEELLLVRTHGNLRNVHIAVAHRHHAEVLFLDALTGGGELRNGAGRGGFRSLSARVGVYFGIQNEHVDVFVLRENVVQTAVADIVCPAVAAEDPDGLLHEAIFRLVDLFAKFVAAAAAILAGFERFDEFIRRSLAAFRVFHVGEPFFARRFAFRVIFPAVLHKLFHFRFELGAAGFIREVDAVAEFRVVLEQAVRPCGAVALFVHGVRAGRGGSAVDGGAARRVRDDHAVAEHLGDHFDVRRFAAARARAGELEQRLVELASLDACPLDGGGVCLLYALGKLPIFRIGVDNFFQRDHFERFVALHAGAHVRANAAAHAIEGRNLHTELRSFQAGRGFGNERIGFFGRIVDDRRADARVRADERALVALDAVFGDPLRDLDRNAALFKLGRTHGHGAVRIERGGGQLVAFEHEDGMNDVLEVLVVRNFHHRRAVGRVRPACGVVDLDQTALRGVDGGVVHVDDRVALAGELFVNGFLHVIGSLLVGHDRIVDVEERRLHDGARFAVQTDLRCDADTVDIVEFEVLFRDLLFNFRGQVLFEFFEGVPGRVQQELAAFLDVGEHVVAGDVGRVVAGNEVSTVDEVRRLNGRFAETEVRNGDAARFFGIVEEIRLRVHIRVVADDLDGILVRADGAVRAEAVELARDRALGSGIVLFGEVERGIRQIVVDTHGEVVLRLFLFEVLVHRVAHGGVELLGAQAVTAADDLDFGNALFKQRRAHVEIEGLAEGAGLFGAVEHRDLLAGLGQSRNERVRNERAVQAHFDQADFVPLFVHLVDGLFHRVCAAAHDDGYVLRVGSAAVVEQVVAAPGELVHLFHHLRYDGGSGEVILVRRFAVLEIGIAVLRRALLDGVFGVERAALEIVDVLHVDERFHLVVVDDVDLGNLVRGAESVKEVQERHLRFERGEVRDEREVHNFLHGAGREHRKTRLAAGHNVLMVAENVQRMRRDRACGNVEHGREQFARDLIHIGDHEEEPLACGIGGGEGACGKGAVHGTRRAAFRLHFGKAQFLPEHVHSARGGPFVRDLRHRGGGGYGIDGRNFRECVSDVAGGGIAVNRHLLHKRYNLRITFFRY